MRAAMAFCASAPSCPYTVDTLTPTFSKTRPLRITLINPPPASEPSSELRLVSVTSNWPIDASAKGPIACADSSVSKAETI